LGFCIEYVYYFFVTLLGPPSKGGIKNTAPYKGVSRGMRTLTNIKFRQVEVKLFLTSRLSPSSVLPQREEERTLMSIKLRQSGRAKGNMGLLAALVSPNGFSFEST